MNEQELSLGLRAIHHERADVADVDAVRRFVLDASIEDVPQRRSWLPHIDTRGFTMVSAIKFVAAAAVVASFGGFLLAGVLTTPQEPEVAPAAATDSPSPLQADELLPGVSLTVEEVRPGIFHVLDDGERDLGSRIRDVTVDGEDRVWVERGTARDWQIVRLGDPGISRQLGRKDPWDLDVTSDGRPSIGSPSAYRVFDGDDWVKRQPAAAPTPARSTECEKEHQFMVDGDCWFVGWPAGGMRRVADGEHVSVPNAELGLADEQLTWGSVAAGDGSGWVFVYEDDSAGPAGAFDGLLGYDRDGWTWIPYEPLDGSERKVGTFPFLAHVIAPDGTLWLDGTAWLAGDEPPDREWLGHMALGWDGEKWLAHGPVPLVDGAGGTETQVAPDGTIWFASGAILREGSLHSLGLPIATLAFESDGTGWVATDGPGGRRHLYVITPEALTAAAR